MAVSIGGGIVKDGLVFHYNTRSIRTFRGKPTTNEFVSSITDSYNGPTNLQTGPLNGVLDAFNGTSPVYKKQGKIRFGNTNGTDIGTLYYGNTYTFSFYARKHPDFSSTAGGDFDVVDRATTKWVDGQVMSGSLAANMTYDWRRFSVTATHDNNSSYRFVDVGPYQDTGFIFEWCCPQIEQNSFPTPYIPFSSTHQTRTNTGVLYDATGKNTITATDLIYNSDGTVSYDGTTGDQRCVINAGTELNALKGSSAITAEAWVYYTSYSGGAESYSVITNSGYPWVWLLENPSQTFRFRTFIGGSDVSATDTSTHSLNTWYHVVGTYDGANHKLYVNGVEKASRADTGVLGSPSYGAYIGTYQGTNYCMSGKIDDVKIYNIALTAKQVKQNFQAGRYTYGI